MGRREQKGESNHFSLGLSLLPSDEEVKKKRLSKSVGMVVGDVRLTQQY